MTDQETSTRRKFIQAGATAAAAGLAGCGFLGGGNNRETTETEENNEMLVATLREDPARNTMNTLTDELDDVYEETDAAREHVAETGLSTDIGDYDPEKGGLLLTDNILLGISSVDGSREAVPNSVTRADTNLTYQDIGGDGDFDPLDSQGAYEEELRQIEESMNLAVSDHTTNFITEKASEIDNVGVFWAEEDDGQDQFNPRLTEDDVKELRSKRNTLDEAIASYVNGLEDLREIRSEVGDMENQLQDFVSDPEAHGQTVQEGEEEVEDLFTVEDATAYLEGEGEYDGFSSLASGSGNSETTDRLESRIGDEDYGNGLEGVYQALQEEEERLGTEVSTALQSRQMLDYVLEEAEGRAREPESPGDGNSGKGSQSDAEWYEDVGEYNEAGVGSELEEQDIEDIVETETGKSFDPEGGTDGNYDLRVTENGVEVYHEDRDESWGAPIDMQNQ